LRAGTGARIIGSMLTTGTDERRAMTYCLVPPDLDHLVAPLRAHFAERADVTVILDRRQASRPTGRDRRRPAVPRQLELDLPGGLAGHAGELHWEQRLRPVRRRLEGAELGVLIGLVAGGDDEAQAELLWRYGLRVRTRLASLRVADDDLDLALQQAFGRLFDRIAGGGVATRSFDALLTRIADAVARERSPAR
jgi:hypothetical protein